MGMELRKLRHLVSLAETLNFARAAAKLHITQPALSRSIVSLERELGVRLCDRGAGGVALTVAGRALVERARQLLRQARDIEHDMALLRDCALGDIAFGIGPMPAATVLTAVVSDVLREHPGLHIRVEINNTGYLLEHLRAEKIEFFVAAVLGLDSAAELAVTPLPALRTGFFVRRRHPLAAKKTVRMPELAPFGLLATNIVAVGQDNLKVSMGLDADAAAPLALVCDSPSFLKEVALGTDGVLLAARASVAAECRAGELVRLPVRNPPSGRADIGVIALRGRSFSPSAELVIGRLKARLQAAVSAAP